MARFENNVDGYSHSHQHLFDELRRLDLLLQLVLERQHHEPANVHVHEFRGLFVSDEEIHRFWEGGMSGGPEPDAESKLQSLQAALENLEHQIAAQTAAGQAAGVHLALPRLKEEFQLAPFEADVLLLCLAPELDVKYEKLFAYLQNDVTSKRPVVDLALRLHGETIAEKIRARDRFRNEAPLFRHHLLSFAGEEQAAQSFLARTLKIDERIVKYLLDLDTLDEALLPFVRVVQPQAVVEELLLPTSTKAELMNIFSVVSSSLWQQPARPGKALCFYGPAGAGKKFTAEALCRAAARDLLVAEVSQLFVNGKSPESLLTRLFREARLRRCAIYLDHAEGLWAEQENAGWARQLLLRALEEFPGLIFIGSEKPWRPRTPRESEGIINLNFPAPDFKSRRQLWQNLLRNAADGKISQLDLDGLTEKFRLTPGKIHQAFAEARHYAARRGGQETPLTQEDLHRASRTQSTANLGSLAQKLKPLYTWNDIMLPSDVRRHLQEICLHVKHRQRVFSEWNFNRKISLGKGLSALFAGPPGTGKTMAAEVIANDLGLEVYKIDLSTVVSKYIGETEKNLSRIFQEAEQSNAILFFDEADALFGKRSEVKDAHDRYANIEINYLLQKMEEYEGIVILASNFQKNIDDAFTRRLRFIVEIPFPDKRYREQIWRNIFPKETPASRDIPYEFLARKFEITGGHIKNIALNAAFLAAENSGVVATKHIIRATKREFQKMGRLCVKADFDEYFELLESDQ